MSRKMSPAVWKSVKIESGFLGEKRKINREVTIPTIYENSVKTGRIDLLKLEWPKDRKDKPHHFWDSDNGKMIEAAAYSLATHPNADLEEKIDKIIDMMEKAQQEDGYLNSYFLTMCPEKRLTDLLVMHELYCAGHLVEGAVAYYQATGKRKFLDIMCKYVDFLESKIGSEEGKIHGYDGHPEIELALIKLYKVTKNKKYYDFAKYLVNERGREPYFFEEEALKQGIELNTTGKLNQDRFLKYYLKSKGPFAQFQSHKPPVEQDEPVGHAVRAMYLYCAMADLAEDDPALKKACERLWEALTTKQMYITGGIGQTAESERFTFEYDLPNEEAYCETCASIGLMMWASRMLQLDGDGKYADVMERALYNGVLSGVSMDGDKFFYSNRLAMYPERYKEGSITLTREDRLSPQRINWFFCSCCPANLARTFSSLGSYMYSIGEGSIYVHLYNNSEIEFNADGKKVGIRQQTDYPWNGDIEIFVSCPDDTKFKMALRLPGWCHKYSVRINEKEAEHIVEKGYIILDRAWKNNDTVKLSLDMPVQIIEANPRVRQNCGRVAIQRGPVVYCFEEVDNFKNLNDAVISTTSEITITTSKELGNVPVICFKGYIRDYSKWENKLYQDVRSDRIPVELKAVPYHLWGNRGLGEMLVWIRAD